MNPRSRRKRAPSSRPRSTSGPGHPDLGDTSAAVDLFGVSVDGGGVGYANFETFAEAKRAAEQYFGSAMGEWQEPPRGVDPGEYAASFFPWYIDWRVGSGPVEREPLYGRT